MAQAVPMGGGTMYALWQTVIVDVPILAWTETETMLCM
jgi:hypothetical protein